MVGRSSALILLLPVAVTFAACVDPFHPDTKPVSQTAPPSGALPGGEPPSPGATPPPATTPPPIVARADGGAPVDAAAPAPARDATPPPPPPADAPADRPAPRMDAPPPPEQIVDCPNPPGDPEMFDCPVDKKILDAWLPTTPPVKGCRPAPHPATECQFYVFAWQNFLIATQPDAAGKPAFLSWNNIENTFGAHAGEPAPEVPVLTGGVTQAGGRQVLVDQKGHAIYYGIHFNKPFVDFVRANDLTSAEAVKLADPNLAFPTTTGIVELKTAWMIVDDASPPANFFTIRAKVSTLRLNAATSTIQEDRTVLRDVTVALIAMHVVYTLPGHPEFVWSSFQHADASNVPDVAPSSMVNPPRGGLRATTVISPKDHLLYKGGTQVSATNKGVLSGAMFDEATQTFAAAQVSNIYRVFPGSKSTDPNIDDDVSALTDNMLALFKAKKASLPAVDKRLNYLLVGAIWQDVPQKTFKLNKGLVNPAGIGPDNPMSITGGEDTMSSTAMESFTQNSDSFPNCFSCHDTQSATATGVPSIKDSTAPVTLTPKLINVSHVFNEVVREGL